MSKREKANFDVLKRIEEERLKRKWTEYTLSKNSGIPQSTISTWNRKGLQPSIASIEKICYGLGISLSQFFDDNKVDALTEEQGQLFHLWDRLRPDQRTILLKLLASFLDEPA